MHNNKHYLAIAEFYGEQRAARSQVPLISHINEGVQILDTLGASTIAKEAYCIHPMLQEDATLRRSLAPDSIFSKWALDPAPVVLAMEYRSVANAYLSQHYQSEADYIGLSALTDVNNMLIADKVQNCKDFEIYHLGKHENSDILMHYFENWLRRLGVSQARYRELVQVLVSVSATD